MSISILGTGSYVPNTVLTNDDLSKMVDTNDKWITERTGIKERRIAVGESLTDMAVKAANRAIDNAKIKKDDIDLIITATITADCRVPSAACTVQGKLGIENAVAFDVNAACSGFIFALDMAKKFIESGEYKTALVIGAEKLSKVINWEDRNTCVLFGDGAGAAVISYSDSGKITTYLKTVPDINEFLLINNPNSNYPSEEKSEVNLTLQMKGPQVFKFATTVMIECVTKVCEKSNVDINDITYIVPHQANKRIIDNAVQRLNIDQEKFFVNLDKYGNTSAASVAIALDELRKENPSKKGDKTILVAFGGGLTAGGLLIEE